MILVKDEQKLSHLRKLRITECFSIINRGKLWYDSLTLSEEAELRDWYAAWLNVTETLIIPKRPSWLDNKINMEAELL